MTISIANAGRNQPQGKGPAVALAEDLQGRTAELIGLVERVAEADQGKPDGKPSPHSLAEDLGVLAKAIKAVAKCELRFLKRSRA